MDPVVKENDTRKFGKLLKTSRKQHADKKELQKFSVCDLSDGQTNAIHQKLNERNFKKKMSLSDFRNSNAYKKLRKSFIADLRKAKAENRKLCISESRLNEDKGKIIDAKNPISSEQEIKKEPRRRNQEEGTKKRKMSLSDFRNSDVYKEARTSFIADLKKAKTENRKLCINESRLNEDKGKITDAANPISSYQEIKKEPIEYENVRHLQPKNLNHELLQKTVVPKFVITPLGNANLESMTRNLLGALQNSGNHFQMTFDAGPIKVNVTEDIS